jgi:Family of unknown function (DUF6639)
MQSRVVLSSGMSSVVVLTLSISNARASDAAATSLEADTRNRSERESGRARTLPDHGAAITRGGMRLTALLLLLVAFDALASNAVGEMVCGDGPVTVIGWTREDAIEVCSAVQASLSWLLAMELTLSDSVTIRSLADQGALANTHRLGRYDARTKEIQILTFDAAFKASVAERPAFGVPMTRDLWRSYVAHEMAHAVADAYFASGVSHLTAGEYIAGVLQLAVLPDGAREEVLENYRKLAGWESAGEISAQYYLMAPGAFAIKSYKHFTALAPSEQRRFITRLTRERLSD